MANTKSKWQAGKLRFYNAPMMVATARISDVVTATGTAATDGEVALSHPLYSGTFTTEGTQHFRASVGGVISSSSAGLMLKLRWGTGVVLQTHIGSSIGTKMQTTNGPWHIDFVGRVTGNSTLTKIVAQAHSHAKLSGGSTSKAFGTTGGGATFASSDHNVSGGSTLGLNIQVIMDTTGGAGGGSAYTVNQGFIQLFD